MMTNKTKDEEKLRRPTPPASIMASRIVSSAALAVAVVGGLTLDMAPGCWAAPTLVPTTDPSTQEAFPAFVHNPSLIAVQDGQQHAAGGTQHDATAASGVNADASLLMPAAETDAQAAGKTPALCGLIGRVQLNVINYSGYPIMYRFDGISFFSDRSNPNGDVRVLQPLETASAIGGRAALLGGFSDMKLGYRLTFPLATPTQTGSQYIGGSVLNHYLAEPAMTYIGQTHDDSRMYLFDEDREVQAQVNTNFVVEFVRGADANDPGCGVDMKVFTATVWTTTNNITKNTFRLWDPVSKRDGHAAPAA